jgi:predicted transcriptional regulator of viral defense system
MLQAAGISARGRAELAEVLRSAGRFIAPADVAVALDIGSEAAAKRLARWAEDGWVRRVRRGLYIGVPVDATNPSTWSEDPLIIAAEVWSPCYFTGWTAANQWTLTEQVFRTTILKTSGRVRGSAARLLDHDYVVVHTSQNNLSWGLRTVWRGDVRLRFADPARTVVEILDTPRLGGGVRHVAEVLASYLDDHDPRLLSEFGDRIGNRAVFKRLGYLIEVQGLKQTALVEACLERLSAGISSLDPDGPPGGRRIMRWGLRINAKVVRDGAS